MLIFFYTFLSAVVGIICGFGIFKLKEIMRKIALIVSSMDILFNVLLLFLSIKDIREYSYSVAVSESEKHSTGLSIDTLVNIGVWSVIFVYLFYIALNLLFIFFFTRPKVKEQFTI